jgi:hypothetical protein
MQLFGRKDQKPKTGFSKTKLLLGAGGLLLFIVGIKRSYRLDDAGGTVLADDALRRLEVDNPVPAPPPPSE